MRKILIIDDSATMRALLTRSLERKSFEVFSAESGSKAVSALSDFDPDLVITDLNMPEMNGIDVVKAIRSNGRFNFVPILILSTESSDHIKDAARQAGATAWMVKPFDDDLLSGTIERILGI